MSASPWIAHVKKYSADHNIPYSEALKRAKSSYKPKKRRGKGVMDKLKEIGQKAMDFATGETGTAIRNALNRNPKSRPLYRGEKHAVEMSGEYKGSSYNFMGPGTEVLLRVNRGDQGINEADNIAKEHDLAYAAIMEEKDPEKRKQMEIDADTKAIAKWTAIQNKTPEVKIAIGAIGAKMAGQLAGKIPWGLYTQVIDETPDRENGAGGRRKPPTLPPSHRKTAQNTKKKGKKSTTR